jgi:hypothetical protein
MNDDSTVILGILSQDFNTIPYRKELNKITGGMIATITLQQFIYLWNRNNSKPFYKFVVPCKHRDYREGDSWTEEIGISKFQFASAFKKLESLKIVSKKIDSQRVSFYTLNTNVLAKLVKKVYTQEEKEQEKEKFPFYEEEFGVDRKSANQKDPSMNEVKKEACLIGKQEGMNREDAIVLAKDFWLGQEGENWNRVKNWKVYLERTILREIKYKKGRKSSNNEPTKEKKIVKPTNAEEMRLFLKQMSDKEREKLVFGKGDETIIINSVNGMPVRKEGGLYLSDVQHDNFMNYLLDNFKDGKLRLKRSLE